CRASASMAAAWVLLGPELGACGTWRVCAVVPGTQDTDVLMASRPRTAMRNRCGIQHLPSCVGHSVWAKHADGTLGAIRLASGHNGWSAKLAMASATGRLACIGSSHLRPRLSGWPLSRWRYRNARQVMATSRNRITTDSAKSTA